MNFKSRKITKVQFGFSLVEMLIVIAVIGVITGISVVTISSITGRSHEATAMRHAQLVASMAGNALHAGNASLAEAGSKEAAVDLLSSGVKGSGSFADVEFRLGLSADEKNDVMPYLGYQNGLLMINPTP